MSGPTRSHFHMQDSAIIFECLNRYIGYEKEVELRRCTKEMCNIVMFKEDRHLVYSGSSAEGFLFESSDIDIMIWYDDIKVVCDTSQIYTQNNIIVLLMDTRHCRPGFTLLKVLSVIDDMLSKLCTFDYTGFYLSASKFREIKLSGDKSSRIHGPCCTDTVVGTDIDYAYCIKCDQWPAQSTEFITRCKRQQWPSVSVLDEIVQEGCHLVPVGAKFSENEDTEWRISFSMAEKKIIFTFNHTQFLCYGLLKIVLTEILNKETNVSELLCSYFLKTAVFWEIQESNVTLWLPQNFLICFWKCFDRLISWVRSDYCPNFFIPPNNMFSGKFSVKQQRNLLQYLQTLRDEGTGLFYRILDMIHVHIPDVIASLNPMFTRYRQYCITSAHLLDTIRGNSEELHSHLRKCLLYKQQNTTAAPAFVIDITLESIVTILLCRELHGFINSTELKNKDRYRIYRSLLYPYMRFINSNSPRNRLCLAAVLYTLGRYDKVLHILTGVQSKIHPVHPEYRILCNDDDLRKYLCLYFVIYKENFILHNEFYAELTSLQVDAPDIFIPPLLYIKWLTFMCFHHMKDRYKCKQALGDLHVLLSDDDGMNVPMEFKDLTYNMVGMCYELYGDHQNALLMYKESMKMNGEYCIAASCRLDRLENKLTVSKNC